MPLSRTSPRPLVCISSHQSTRTCSLVWGATYSLSQSETPASRTPIASTGRASRKSGTPPAWKARIAPSLASRPKGTTTAVTAAMGRTWTRMPGTW